jgi:hypothetical protein
MTISPKYAVVLADLILTCPSDDDMADLINAMLAAAIAGLGTMAGVDIRHEIGMRLHGECLAWLNEKIEPLKSSHPLRC